MSELQIRVDFVFFISSSPI